MLLILLWANCMDKKDNKDNKANIQELDNKIIDTNNNKDNKTLRLDKDPL